MTPTHFRKPKTHRLLRVEFRCGLISRFEYHKDQLVWKDRGWPFDIIAVEFGEKRA